jgi:hypothetical protein
MMRRSAAELDSRSATQQVPSARHSSQPSGVRGGGKSAKVISALVFMTNGP